MKKFLITILFLTVLINKTLASEVLVSPIYPNSVRSVETLAHWLEINFTYQKENNPLFDYWKTPKETIRDKGGDCEDFAILVAYILDDLGIENHILCVTFQNRKTGHAINVFKNKDGKWNNFSNTELNDYPFDTIKELLDAQQWNWKKARFATSRQTYYDEIENEVKE